MAKELNLGVIFYGVATKAMQSIDQLEARLKKLNTGFVVSGKAATSSSKAISGQAKSAKGLANEMSLVGKKIGQVTGGIQRLTAAMKVTASYGLAATAIFGVINAFKAGTAAIFDFDQALKNLQAITGAIDAEIAVLGDKIREVAARTKYSAKEVSDATVLLGQAGFDAAESLDAIEAVAMLATGTLTDMATTADLLTTAIRAFDLETSEAGKVADIFATAVNKSKLTIDKLRTAFNYLGPVASNAGLSLEETAASTMVLANAGLRGSTIGTGFRQVLARLIAPSEKLRLAFRAAGADLEKLNPLTNDFSVVLDELSKVVTHSGIAIRLFGMRASAAAVAIAKGSDKYKEMLDYTYRVGVATEMAEKQMEGLAVMAKNLGDKLHNLAIALGEGGIAGAFRVALNILRPLVDLMTLAADNVIGRFIVAVTSLTAVMTALTLVTRYLVIQLSAITIGLSVAALKTKMVKESANLLVVAIAGMNMALGKLYMALRTHPFVAVVALLASLYAGFKLWRQSVAEQTIELQKQSIMLAKEGFQLEAYAEQLDKAKEGSKKYEAIMKRLLNDYPELADAVDLTTMKWKDQGEALKELIDLKHDEYVGKLIELVGEYGDKIDSLRVKIALYALTIGKVTKDTKEFWEETKRGEYAFPGAEKLAKTITEAFGTAWDFMKFSTGEAYDYWKDKLVGMAEDTKEVTEIIELQQETIKTIAGRLKKYGIDAESTIGAIAASIYALGEKSMEAAIKMAEAVKQHLAVMDKPKDDPKKPQTNLEMLLDKEWHAWGEFYQKLEWVEQDRLMDVFDKTEKAITKKRKELKIRYAIELADAKTREETEKNIQAILAGIRAKALIKLKADLTEKKESYKAFFDKVIQLRLKALAKDEESEEQAAKNRHAKRMADFKKDFEAEDDYLEQSQKAKKQSGELLETELNNIRAKYFKKRLDQEIEFQEGIGEQALIIAKADADRLAREGAISKKEANKLKLELEKEHWVDMLLIWDTGLKELEKKYGKDTEAFKDAVDERADYLKKLFEFGTKADVTQEVKIKFGDLPFLDQLMQFVEAFSGTSEGFVKKVDDAGNIFYEKINETKDILAEVFTSIIEKMSDDLIKAGAFLTKSLGTAGGFLGDVFTKIGDKLGEVSVNFGGALGAIITLILNLDKVIDKIADLPDMFARVFADFGDNIRKLGKGFENLSEGVGEFVAELGGAVIDALTSIINAVADLPTQIGEAIPQLIQGIIDALPELARALVKLIGNAAYGTVKKTNEAFMGWFKGGEDKYVEKTLPKALENINATIDNFVTNFNAAETAINNVNEQFDTLIEQMKEAGMSAHQLAEVEMRRAEVISEALGLIRRDFIAGLEDTIAKLTLGPLEYELRSLEIWYKEQLNLARSLGGEAIAVLKEAYELSKLQYALKLKETLLGMTEKYQLILDTINLTPLEMLLRELVGERQTGLDALEEIANDIGAYLEIQAGLEAEREVLRQKVSGYEADVAVAYNRWQAILAKMATMPDWQAAMWEPRAEKHEEIYNRILREATRSISRLEEQIKALDAAIAELTPIIGDLGDDFTELEELALAAYEAQRAAIAGSVTAGWADIIRDLTLTDFEKGLFALDEWYAEQLIAAELLELALDDLNYAYELQLQALQNLGQAIDETIASIDDMIESLTGGELAPVQSAEYYMDKYAGFLEAAMMGTAGAVDELLGFIPEYLDFMSGYGLDYAGLTASIVAQLENLKLTLPGLQHGGLTSGLSFAGEAGPEWVVPTYEPQRSSFLEDVGMDPDKIGEAIARHLIPALGSREINLTIDGQPVRAVITKGLRSDSELINAVRRVN